MTFISDDVMQQSQAFVTHLYFEAQDPGALMYIKRVILLTEFW